MTTLLFTGGGGAGNEALERLWRDRYELHFADADPAAFSPSLPKQRCHVLPFASEPSFVGSLAGTCERISADMLIPGVDEELPLLGALAERLPRLRILAPDPNYVLTMLDKMSAMAKLIGSGIDAPRTVTLDRIHEIGFPCFAKPRRGRGSRGIAVLRDAAAASAYGLLSGLPADQTVAQELLHGQEYTVMMAADSRNRLRAVVPVRVESKRGITLRAETEAHTIVIEACKAIHLAQPTVGCYNIQLILTPEGRVRPFEINPRISTTFCLGVASGVDPVALFFEDGAPEGLLPFRPGVRLRRHWHNEIS